MRTAQLSQSSFTGLPSDSFIYSISYNPHFPFIASISSDDSLQCLDPENLQVISKFLRVHEGITCLDDSPLPGCLITAGRDGNVRSWDTRAGRQVSELVKDGHSLGQADDANRDPILAMSVHHGPNAHSIAVGTELTDSTAKVIIWDTRKSDKVFLEFSESHSDDVTELCWVPGAQSWLLSGSTDGLVNIYDAKEKDEEEAVMQTINHGSVHHATFLSDTAFAAVSHDEVFGIYDLRDETSKGRVLGDVRPRLNCQYVVDVANIAGQNVIVSASTADQNVTLTPFSTSNDHVLERENSILLPGGHGDDVVRSITCSPDHSVLYTAGEDAVIKAWRLPGWDEPTDEPARKKHRKE